MFQEAVEDCCYNSCTTAWTGPEGTRVGAPKFQDSQHMQLVRLSALRASRLYLPTRYT